MSTVLVHANLTVGFVGRDVGHGFAQPRHVGHLAEDRRDFVDLSVIVGFRQDITQSLAVGTVANVVAG